jgi:hypothetical protein
MTDWNNDFTARVNFAANRISSGGRTSRRFDSCFENHDGDEVVVALYRRTIKNPNTKLAANLFLYLCRHKVMSAVEDLAHVRSQDLPNVAAQTREKARADFEALMQIRGAA